MSKMKDYLMKLSVDLGFDGEINSTVLKAAQDNTVVEHKQHIITASKLKKFENVQELSDLLQKYLKKQ
jgi:ribosomal protein L17